MIQVNGIRYEIMEDFREGWNDEAFKNRYSEVLSKYDYIVGDWGYNQLRLKGFYEDNHDKATIDTKISAYTEYLMEYCNFGCPYFLIRKLK
jgi:uncharacterized protein YutD